MGTIAGVLLSLILLAGCAAPAAAPTSAASPLPTPTLAPTPTPTPLHTPKPTSDYDAMQALLAALAPSVAAYDAALLAGAKAANAYDSDGMIAAMTDAVSAASDMIAAVDNAEIRPCFAAWADTGRRTAIAGKDGHILLVTYWTAGPSGLQSTFDEGMAKVKLARKLADEGGALADAVSCEQ